MFGYIIANKEDLAEADAQRYHACYCGLCQRLGEVYGLRGRVTLTYDMTFLILLLSSLYEPETEQGQRRCIVHPFKSHTFWRSSITDYAADMNVALAYHNCWDDWQDDRNLAGYSEARLLRKHYDAIEKRYPRQCQAIAEGLFRLAAIEKTGVPDLDGAANAFGALMAEIFVRTEDSWADALRRMAAGLGRFIYTMDAYEDVEKDTRKGRYNPLAHLRQKPDFEGRCKRILTLFLGECAIEFEKLPLVQDLPILRNILYSGVWTKYTLLQKKKERNES